MNEHPFQPSAHVPISCAVCGQEQRFHAAPDDLLTTVKAEQLRYKRNGCFPSAELADTWIDALVARVEQAEGEVANVWCSQCGQYLWKPGCGPTHAARWAALEADHDSR